jgi:hypothetical protein
MQKDTDAKSKLREKLKAERMKRQNRTNQRTVLEKNKVPENLIDMCMNQMNGKTPMSTQTMQNILHQLSMISKGSNSTEEKSTNLMDENVPDLIQPNP